MSEMKTLLQAIRDLLEEQVNLLRRQAHSMEEAEQAQQQIFSGGFFKQMTKGISEKEDMFSALQRKMETRQEETVNREKHRLAIEEERNELLRKIVDELSLIRQKLDKPEAR